MLKHAGKSGGKGEEILTKYLELDLELLYE